ncbi:MAG: ABC transporter permease [Xanthobacteraceae bacterium]
MTLAAAAQPATLEPRGTDVESRADPAVLAGVQPPATPTSFVAAARTLISVPWLLALAPAALLFFFFLVPTLIMLSLSVVRSEAIGPHGDITLANYVYLLSSPFYVWAVLRTFIIGISTGVLVVAAAFPVAFFLAHTRSRFRGALIALCLTPLLASVVVRTYGWYIILSNYGLFNETLLSVGAIDARIHFVPSTAAIVVGLVHALLPYGILTIMNSLTAINPNVVRAAQSLGATRLSVFVKIIMPLCIPGIVGGFLLAFTGAISAFATAAILGGPKQETIATLINTFMTGVLDWSLSGALGGILIVSTIAVTALGYWFGVGKARI